jgi:hypothetical protein
MMIHDDYLVLVELHHRWKELEGDLGKMPRDDAPWWQLVDNLNAKEFEALKNWAFRSPMLRNRSDMRIWAENKIATKPFQVRPPKIRWKNNYENKYLWTLLMNAMEQIERDL